MPSDYKQVTPLICVTLALVAKNVWFNLVGYSPAFAIDSVGDPIAAGRMGFIVTSAVLLIALSLFGQKAIGPHTFLFSFAPLVMFMGTGMFGLAPSQTLTDPGILLMTGGVLMGLGNAWGSLCIYAILGGVGSMWHIVICSSASSVAAAVISPAIQGFSSPEAQVTAATLSVVVLFVSLLVAFTLLDRAGRRLFPLSDGHLAQATPAMGGTRAVLSLLALNRRQIFQLVIVTVAMIALRGSNSGGIWGGQRVSGTMFSGSLEVMSLVFLVMALVSFRIYFNNARAARYHVPFLVLIACFLLLTYAGGLIDGSLSNTLSSSIELFCQLLFTFTVVDSMRKIPSLGIVLAGCASGLSWVLALAWMVALEPVGQTANSIIALITYLLVVLVASPNDASNQNEKQTRRDANHESAISDATAANPFDSVIEQSRILSREHHLTKREGEVLEYLAQGRSAPYICKELTLAEGTVRTHTMRIYHKLDVHSKQELLDLLANQRPPSKHDAS